MKDQSARGGEHAGVVGLLRTDEELLPDRISCLYVEGAHITGTGVAGVGIPIPDAAGLAIDATILGSHQIEQLGVWVERSGVPVGRAAHPGAGLGPADRGSLAGDQYRRAVRMKPARPSHLLYERLSEQELSVGSVQHIEDAAALGRKQQLALLAMPGRIHQQ